ncbi:hypothetical protein BLNAU_4812 [Blattamonas nauphoetae]|uniref:Protein kinase domain-containing protein n=1 Tax=Blattamonas nauphoetae TaxID=2049346 RepID=A0ABQ9Y9C4_9EUKA|nr:hypothetical protein BLNAU_4812 [Blattamonas nauphoetae]
MTSTHNTHTESDSRLSQTCLGVSVKESIGTLQGTMIQDVNAGGSLLCQNSTFSKCESTNYNIIDSYIMSTYGYFLKKYLKHFHPPYTFSKRTYSQEDFHSYWSIGSGTEISPPSIYRYATSVTPVSYIDCTFSQMIENPSPPYDVGGSAIFYRSKSPLTITRSRFSECKTAQGAGGAINLNDQTNYGPTVVITSSNFTKCSAQQSGGAIQLQSTGQNSITYCLFEENTVDGNGGGVNTDKCEVFFTKFVSNRASSSGALHGHNLSLMFCHFWNNTNSNGYSDSTALDFANQSPAVFGNTQSTDRDAETSDVLFVLSGGQEGTCLFDDPCGSLGVAVSKIPVDEHRDLRIRAGSFDAVTLQKACDVKIIQQFTEDVVNEVEQVVSFSLSVPVEATIILFVMSLSPLKGHPIISCTFAPALITLENIRLTHLTGITLSPFIFSAGTVTITVCRFEEIKLSSAPIIAVSGLDTSVVLTNTFFRDLTSTASVITVVDSSLDVSSCLFRSLTRTVGEGAAAIDATNARLRISSSFAYCRSQTGKSGAMSLRQIDPICFEWSQNSFLGNRGKDDSVAHDIYVSDFDFDVSLFPSLVSTSAFPSVVDKTGSKISLRPFSDLCVFEDDSDSLEQFYYLGSVNLKDLDQFNFTAMILFSDSFQLSLYATIPLDLFLKPVVVGDSEAIVIDAQGRSSYSTITQASGTSGSLFTFESHSTMNPLKLTFIHSSQQRSPMFNIAEDATVSMSYCIVTSDGGLCQAPVFVSKGVLTFAETTIRDFTFSSFSCIETTGGELQLQSQTAYNPSLTAASNLSTSSNGALLNARNTKVTYLYLAAFDCHATNGGCIFVDAGSEVEIRGPFFRCTATKCGGAVFVQNGLVDTEIKIEFGTVVNCSAELGGGLFFNSTAQRGLNFDGKSQFETLTQSFSLPTFFGCRATKGAGAYLSGIVNPEAFSMQFWSSSNGEPTEGTDLYIAKSFADCFTNLTDVLAQMQTYTASLSGMSLSDGRYKHVHVEGHPEQSINFDRPFLFAEDSDKELAVSCPDFKDPGCSSISQYLPLFHTQKETGEYIQIPIYLKETLFVSDTEPVTKQSVLIAMLNDPDNLGVVTEVAIQNSVQEPSSDSVLVEVGEDGAVELGGLKAVCEDALTLLVTVDISSKGTMSNCEIRMNTTQTLPLVVCRKGSVKVLSSQFLLGAAQPLVSTPLIVSHSSSLGSNSDESEISVEVVDVTFQNLKLKQDTESVIVLDSANSITLSRISFMNVLFEDDTQATRITVRGRELGQVVQRLSGHNFPNRGSGEDSLYKSHDVTKAPDTPFHSPTLLLYLSPYKASLIHVKAEGSDAWGCGDDVFTCRSLDEADGHLLAASPSTVLIHDTAELNEGVVLTQDKMEVKSKEEKSIVIASSLGSIINQKNGTTPHELALTSLSFLIVPDHSTALLRLSHGIFVVTTCSFTIASPTIESFNSFHNSPRQSNWIDRNGEETETDICDMSSALLQLDNCSATLTHTSFSHIGEGALKVVDSTVSIQNGSFTQTTPLNPQFASLQKYVDCSGSSTVELITSDSNTDTPNLWISTDSTCVVKSDGQEVSEPFFVPTLTISDCNATIPKKGTEYTVVVKGAFLLPCGTSFAVREVGKGDSAKEVPFQLSSELVTSYNETNIAMTIPTSALSSLDSKAEWNGVIMFGRSGQVSFQFKMSSKQARAQAFQKSLPWLIPLIVVLFLIVVVGIIILVCLWRRRKTKKDTIITPVRGEMEEEEDTKIEAAEPEELEVGQAFLEPSEGVSHVMNESASDEPALSQIVSKDISHVEAVECGEMMKRTIVREEDTLFNRLHSPKEQKAILKRVVQCQLSLGLAKAVESNMNPDMFTQLSPHSILFDSKEQLCLRTTSPIALLPQPAPTQPPPTTRPVDQDGRRWNAPEVFAASEDKSKPSEVDVEKAGVFSLGLIVWEIETGLVPFAEQDVVNTQRQLSSGVLPPMTGISADVADLIQKCLQLSPSDRPSLSEVSSILHSLPTDAHEVNEHAMTNEV